MSTVSGNIVQQRQEPIHEANEPPGLVFRLGLFVLFLMAGLAILVFGSNYYTLFPTNRNLAYNILLSAICLIAAVLMKRAERLARYWQIAFAFFVASVAFPITLLLGGFSRPLLAFFNLTASSSQGMAVAKLYEALLIVVPILALTKLSGGDLGSLYIKRGNLKWGLLIGGGVLLNLGSSAFMFFATRYTSLGRLGAAVLWGAVFSLANGFMEELWLRGVFLKKMTPLLGVTGTLLLTCTVFSLMHAGAVYLSPPVIPFMLVNTFTLGFACAYVMMKTDSIWGPTLMHAAADLFLFIAMLANP